MSHPAQSAVQVLQQWAEASFERVLPFELLDLSPSIWGFGVSHQGGLTLVWCDVTDASPQDSWVVTLTGGIALDVPDPVGALVWSNNRSRLGVHGKHYCAVAREGNAAAVVYEVSLTHVLFNLLFDGPHGPGTFQSLAGHARGLLNLVVQSAAEGGADVTGSLGGRLFPPDEDGLTTLFTISSG